MAIQWFDNCLRNHAKCSERFADSDQLPTRLIDVGPLDGTQEPRLVLSSELQGCLDLRYITLSHRWASSTVLKLESTNIESLRRCIPLESLPQTFVDAIEVTRALSARYLWIDSLCILQDSLDDWQAEAAEMGRVYQNCFGNLAATGAAATTVGSSFDANPNQEREAEKGRMSSAATKPRGSKSKPDKIVLIKNATVTLQKLKLHYMRTRNAEMAISFLYGNNINGPYCLPAPSILDVKGFGQLGTDAEGP